MVTFAIRKAYLQERGCLVQFRRIHGTKNTLASQQTYLLILPALSLLDLMLLSTHRVIVEEDQPMFFLNSSMLLTSTGDEDR